MSSKVTLRSIQNVEHDGWMTKQGGSFKNWKRRWFALHGPVLYYFKGNTPDTDLQGQIDLTSQSFVKPEQKHGRRQAFAVATPKRIFFMYADSDEESVKWIKLISQAIERLKTPVSALETPRMDQNSATTPPVNEMSPSQARLQSARLLIPFLQTSESNKVLEFWQIWFDSIPERDESKSDMSSLIGYEVAISADMHKVSWRAAGPQNVFIQKMVDFFWNVGAPESEIDRLNDVGALINPPTIGSWIDMSRKEGMDGGWYFPSEIPLKYALDAFDLGKTTRTFSEWAEMHQISVCTSIGRDMGAAPPRQTEIRLTLGRNGLSEQLEVVLSACQAFEFPPFSDAVLDVIRSSESNDPLKLSVVTSSEGFVRIGLLHANPSLAIIEQLCQLSANCSSSHVIQLAQALEVPAPKYVELQYLNTGFGYGVYREGFEVNFHFLLNEETSP